MRRTHLLLPGVLSLLATTGCTVYAPMQPRMPLVRQRGQLETGASIQPLGRVEATAAYSPAAHVVVAGGLTGAARLADQHFLATRQFELGAGLYQPLGPRWLLSSLGGYGQAYAHRGYVDLGILTSGTYSEYTASYDKYYLQVGLAKVLNDFSQSYTYRLVRVRFDYLVDSRLGPLPLSAMTRHELMAAYRYRLGNQALPRWEFTYGGGVSVASTPRLDDHNAYPASYEANRNLLSAFVASFGVVFWPGRPRAGR